MDKEKNTYQYSKSAAAANSVGSNVWHFDNGAPCFVQQQKPQVYFVEKPKTELAGNDSTIKSTEV